MRSSCSVRIIAALVSGFFLAHCGSEDDGGGGSSGGSGGGGVAGAAGDAGASGQAGMGGQAATAGMGGGTAGTAGSGGATGTLCEQRCNATASLGCPNDSSCVQNCQTAIDYAPWCSTIMSEFVSCSLDQPIDNWQCDARGASSLKEGICQAQAEAGVRCLVDGPPEGMPDLSAECAATCAAMSGLSCVPDDCEKSCNDALQADACAGAAGLVSVCGASLTAADYDCSQGIPLPTGGECSDQVNLLLACLQGQGQ